jgi:hypothetical protein
VAEVLGLLRDEPVLAVVGDSGSGKSSLLQAGLAPAVRQGGLGGQGGWRIVYLRPGSQPGRSLVGALLLGEGAPDDLLAQWREQMSAAPEGGPARSYDDWLRVLGDVLRGECGPGRPLLLLFDQFEEMFTLCHDEAQRRALAAALAKAAKELGERFRLVLALYGHGNNVTEAAFSRDSQQLVSASADKTIRVWDGHITPALPPK